jgi:SpoVK/Ycf46/Vps4 family AAA+-type ATPase
MSRKNKFKFRSYTDIHNYNKFLMELDDKKLKENTKQNEIHNIDGIPVRPPELKRSHCTEGTNKDFFIKTMDIIDKKYYESNCCDSQFNGVNLIESLLTRLDKMVDPNMHQSQTKKEKEKDKDKETKSPQKQVVKTKKIHIDACVEDINDLLYIISAYEDDDSIDYNINVSALHKIKEPLTQLNNMIGMKNLKENVVDQILFYIQNLQTSQGNDFMHTVIYGPPGTGKTEIAKIMGSIFAKLGILSKGTFKKVTRSDLVAGYLGQTALKTKDVIKESIGGVLFIDEAYSLGNQEKRDSFSKECIDTLCESLSDNKDNLMVIVAGYEKDLEECFFSHNQGLNSRFTWRFQTDEYSADDLHKIFLKKVADNGWSILEEESKGGKIDVKWFEKNNKHFKSYGRDIETLLAKSKIAHSRRIFGMDESVKKKLTLDDLNKGMEIYLKNNHSNKKMEEDENKKRIFSSMYV